MYSRLTLLKPFGPWLLAVAFCVSAGPATAPAQTPDFEKLIASLGAQHANSVRIKAAETLGSLDKDPRSITAVPALIACLKDTNDEVRYQALANLTFILGEHQRPCPPEIFGLVEDTSPKIKTNLPYLLDFYETFPPEGLDFCLNHFKNLSAEKKPDALVLLGKAGGKDKRILQILLNAVNSENARMRVNGTAGLWAATHDLELLLPLYFDRLADARELEKLPANDNGRFQGSHPRIHIQLAEIGTAGVFLNHLATRHDKFIEALRKLANSTDLHTRRSLSDYVATCLRISAEQYQDPINDQSHETCDYSEIQKLANDHSDDPDTIVSKNYQSVQKHIAILSQN